MFFFILGGVSISLIFRYILNWQSTKQDYIRFVILWLLYLVCYFVVEKPKPVFSKAELMLSLEDKCHSEASACGLSARLFITDGNFTEALSVIEKGLRLDPDLHTLLQMKLIYLCPDSTEN